jgi:hypothetical protein
MQPYAFPVEVLFFFHFSANLVDTIFVSGYGVSKLVKGAFAAGIRNRRIVVYIFLMTIL